MPINATTQTHDDVLRVKAERPSQVIVISDERVKNGGPIWRGSYAPSNTESFELLALTSPDSWAEVAWVQPTTTLGVQFAGNQDDGWAKILVDGETVWEGNTFGERGKFNRYVEIDGLADSSHAVRVEVMGRAGTEGGGIDVTLTAFGWGQVSAQNRIDNSTQIFAPFIAGGNSD